MTTQIVEYSKTEAALADLAQRYKGVVFDVATTVGMTTARKGRAEIRGYRTALETLRVEIKAPALERCRLIDAEAKRITAELIALEEPIDALIKNEEQRREREKAEKERQERERVERIQAAIAKVGNDAASMAGKSSEQIAVAIETVSMFEVGEWAGEFKEQAQAAKDAARAKLDELHAAAVAHEEEQARIKAERVELARLKAEQEQRQLEEQIRNAEDRRKREEEESAARAKIEAEERAARERILEHQRKADAERAEADRIAREKREAEELEARRKQAEEDARLKAERDRIRVERIAIEERERKAREDEAELMGGRKMLETFVQRFGRRKEFAPVAAAIKAFLAEAKAAA